VQMFTLYFGCVKIHRQQLGKHVRLWSFDYIKLANTCLINQIMLDISLSSSNVLHNRTKVREQFP